MITNPIENEHINRVGPGPEAYDHLNSLKNVIAKKPTTLQVMKKPTDLDTRVKKLHNVNSSKDLQDSKLLRPGPGSYDITDKDVLDHEMSKYSSNLPSARKQSSGVTVPKYERERLMWGTESVESPGPARYSTAKAAMKMKNAVW